ncbi:P-loop containing nucleoside triphosphate hydrolase protein [Obba rivulosa]|uniref:P-loop containing nucleoside triphosphate hydrolase protein n=1 Tax=Obba rivulosa TaxID=1052685 RepID=A0A8E2DJP9_9APHY|nr:P-loop containing nucleoside triphosphate hydrolase protein [Obba rivulosa]
MSSVRVEDLNETLLPRRYQEEIFSRAQDGNVIAALDTGSGKTYISTLLIRWISVRDAGLGKIIVFLVPKVALVDQQGDFVAKHTPLRVSKFCGATAIDMADRSGWLKELENVDVLVMTAQLFLNILTHGHWALDKVSLMVIDECHHTRKNHAYNGIMREYFQLPARKRPKIFGMTASPVWNPKDAMESLSTLERNLDAKVMAVRQHIDELKAHAPKPKEWVHEYPSSPPAYPEYPSCSLWERLSTITFPSDIDIPVEKIHARYEMTLQTLGPYGADLFLYMDLRQRISQILDQAMEGDLDSVAIKHYYQDGDIYMAPTISDVQLPPQIKELEFILDDFRELFEDETNPDVVPVTVHLKWCSPKVRTLIDILFDQYTSTFQGIIFVEQRHVAACLARMLPRVPQLSHLIRCAQLIGHGTSNNIYKSRAKGMAVRNQQDVVKLFRERQVNLLVATSVAEEGLDFPACDLVIRFDPLQHMVGYLQSRGRARHQTSTFIIMVEQGHEAHIARYRAFAESEPQIRQVYQTRDDYKRLIAIEEEEEGEIIDPLDIAERERFVVPSTGAVLTYNSASGLLHQLCTLVPRDRFTPIALPKYEGDFISTIRLPLSLPLPPEHLVYTGPEKRSKKEAKRAVAFVAVKNLHALNVFDDYLLPAKSVKGRDREDPDGWPLLDVSKVPHIMHVLVRDPWTRGEKQYLHIVYLDGRPTAGLITGTLLPPVELACGGIFVSAGEGQPLEFDAEDEWHQRRGLEDFMRIGLWWCITGKAITLPLTCYLVPITHELQVDFDAIERTVRDPHGSPDWSEIGEEHCGRVLVMCSSEHGRPLILRRIRDDITPMSRPPEGSREGGHATYWDYWTQRWTRKRFIPDVPEGGPCIEAEHFVRHITCAYALDHSDISPPISSAAQVFLYPQRMCRVAQISEDVFRTFHILPELCHRITDVWRARTARAELGLPPIADDLMVQALTLPAAAAGFSNQLLETLGDAVLKLGAAVHLFNKYPHRHEGQLDMLRRTCVCNRTLLARAIEHRLEQYLTSETQHIRVWRYITPEDHDPSIAEPLRFAARTFPRRSLQDCMEATLGASFATGGIQMALRAGTALGLSFGGPLPWNVRYGGRSPENPVSPLFSELQEALVYQFKHGQLLFEAVTHPSFGSYDNMSYQRLEFLGDALIDLVVMRYLYFKYPKATSGQLSWARSRAVCASALAWAAVNRLELHKILLVNNVGLSVAIGKYVPILKEISNVDIINNGWKQDPPKAISDVLESVLGAVLIDSDYDFEKAAVVVETAMADLLAVLTPDLPRDPISELMVWAAQSSCCKITFRKVQSRPDVKRYDAFSVIAHDIDVVGPVAAPNLSRAKGLAAERARVALSDPSSPYHLSRICNCGKGPTVEVEKEVQETIDTSEPKALDDETEIGFTALARVTNEELGGSESAAEIDTETNPVANGEEENKLNEPMQVNQADQSPSEPEAVV